MSLKNRQWIPVAKHRDIHIDSSFFPHLKFLVCEEFQHPVHFVYRHAQIWNRKIFQKEKSLLGPENSILFRYEISIVGTSCFGFAIAVSKNEAKTRAAIACLIRTPDHWLENETIVRK